MFRYFIGLMVSVVGAAFAADKSKSHHHEVHAHGQGELNVAIDGGDLLLELKMPAQDLVGFEYEPKTSEQKSLVEKVKSDLMKGTGVFELPNSAECKLKNPVDVEVEFPSAKEPHGHAEFHTIYKYECSKPKNIDYVTLLVFKDFSKIKKVDFQLISATGQTSGALTPQNNIFKIKP